MANLMQRLMGKEPSEKDEVERLARSIWARNKWAQLTTLQRVRIEMGAAAGVAADNHLHMNPEGTLRFWLADQEIFAGVTMVTFEQNGRLTIRVTDGKEEFLARDEGDGVNISAVRPLGEAELINDEEIAEERARRGH